MRRLCHQMNPISSRSTDNYGESSTFLKSVFRYPAVDQRSTFGPEDSKAANPELLLWIACVELQAGTQRTIPSRALLTELRQLFSIKNLNVYPQINNSLLTPAHEPFAVRSLKMKWLAAKAKYYIYATIYR